MVIKEEMDKIKGVMRMCDIDGNSILDIKK